MSRINTNISSLLAQQALNSSNTNLQTALTRLSTGKQINSGADNPAGLIAAEALGSEITNTQQAVSNSQMASNMISTADSALGQISTLLTTIQGLVNQSASTGTESPAQIAANQQQVDAALDSINTIASSTTFQGKNLLDGTMAYTTSNVAGGVSNVQISKANLTGGSLGVTADVTTAASQATLVDATDFDATDKTSAALDFTLTGSNGSQVFSFDSGTTGGAIADAINGYTAATGISASYAPTVAGNPGTPGTLTLTATNIGSAGSVTVAAVNGGTALATTDTVGGSSLLTDTGADIAGTINGVTATGIGNTLSVDGANLALSMNVAVGTDGNLGFNIGGGATFQIGAVVGGSGQATLGIQSTSTTGLGGLDGILQDLYSGSSAALATDPATAASIVNEAINQVSSLRGQLGSFQSETLDSNINSLNAAVTNLTSAQSSIQDTDFAAESAALTQAQVLVQSGTAVLSIANHAPANVLTLLQGAAQV
ncbi:MAG: flagellin [Thermoguttaceae bacterium]